MSYKVLLRRHADGEERTVEYRGDWSELMDFIWTEGNCACDCYRAAQFGQEAPCGSELYDAVHVELPDGTKLPLDDL